MKKRTALPTLLVVAAAAWTLMSSAAFAVPSYGVCTGCHASSASVSVKVTETANTGGNATYDFTVTSAGSTVGWAVFDGATNIANGHGKTGSFQVADGKIYSLYVRDTSAGVASTSFSPVTPPADKTAPTTTSDAKTTYPDSATIKLTATDNAGGSGVAHTYYILDSNPQAEGTTINVATAGPHSIQFWSVDTANNVESPRKTASFQVTAAPVQTGNTLRVRIALNHRDYRKLHALMASANGATYVGTIDRNGMVTFTGVPAGVYKLTVTGRHYSFRSRTVVVGLSEDDD